MYAKLQNWIETNGIHLFYLVKRKKYILHFNKLGKIFLQTGKIFQDFMMYQLTIDCSQKQTKKSLSKRKIFQVEI